MAAAEAEQREAVSELLVNLARRNQSLLNRQLGLISDLEQRERQPDVLDELFQLDHLATRIRRNAESLLVLSGDEPSRLWGQPVPLPEVVRAAAAEVEEYRRVDVQVNDHLEVVGRAVADVAHLLAELIENATTFSPPTRPVLVRSHLAPGEPRGFVVSVEDIGIGMSDDELRRANDLLADAPEVDLRRATMLGFHVVARLAARYGIAVSVAADPGRRGHRAGAAAGRRWSASDCDPDPVVSPSPADRPAVPKASGPGRGGRACGTLPSAAPPHPSRRTPAPPRPHGRAAVHSTGPSARAGGARARARRLRRVPTRGRRRRARRRPASCAACRAPAWHRRSAVRCRTGPAPAGAPPVPGEPGSHDAASPARPDGRCRRPRPRARPLDAVAVPGEPAGRPGRGHASRRPNPSTPGPDRPRRTGELLPRRSRPRARLADQQLRHPHPRRRQRRGAVDRRAGAGRVRPASPATTADTLAAVTSGLTSLTIGAARHLGTGGVNQVIVEMDGGYLFVTTVSDGSALAVMCGPECDIGLIGYEMSLLVARIGPVLTPALRSELRGEVPAMAAGVSSGDDDPRVVPVYALTGGRTRSTGEDLALETLVTSTDAGPRVPAPSCASSTPASSSVCRTPVSVVEVAATLVGAARRGPRARVRPPRGAHAGRAPAGRTPATAPPTEHARAPADRAAEPAR